jgi:N-acyl homoserine lactone hydrolase
VKIVLQVHGGILRRGARLKQAQSERFGPNADPARPMARAEPWQFRSLNTGDPEMKRLSFALALALTAHAADAADVELWRLDCGTIELKDMNVFSDNFAYKPAPKTLTDSCYLIRHDADYVLWDSGLPAALLNAPTDPDAPMSPTLAKDLPSQLAEIGVAPDKIGWVGISHGHFDHTGQAGDFPQARLLIGQADFDAMNDTPPPFGFDPSTLDHWRTGNGAVDKVTGDKDVFGDGSVTLLAMPGHTKGEMALLVRLAETGPVLLSGDVVHFHEQIAAQSVPSFNMSRAESLASMARMEAVAKNLNATLVIQHDPADISLLPAFPASAK